MRNAKAVPRCNLETVQYKIKNPDELIHEKQYGTVTKLCILAEQASAKAGRASNAKHRLQHLLIGHACLARSINLLIE